VSGDHRLGRDGSRLTILYDADCGICGLTARTLRRWDREGRFETLPLQAAARSGEPRLAAAARRHALAEELHVVDAVGRVAAGGDALLAIVDRLPGGVVLRPWAALSPFRGLTRAAYRVIARNRDRIGRWSGLELACPSQSPADPPTPAGRAVGPEEVEP
jgi:predicted DCC family thiol-disulfide oxidoreductase YuxK